MSESTSIASTLAQKKWFGFDLDDTLHEFRKASAQASQSVFEVIHSHTDVNIESLKSSYSEILQSATADAFTDGRTSTDYRRDRFTRLLQAHGINELGQEDHYIAHLLGVYKSSLGSSLTLKAGALSFLQALKQRGKKIVVVTEGPTDAQEWTIRELGLEPYVDVLVTTNEAGCSKVDGLFGVMLDKFEIHSEDLIYFGDDAIRDTQASQKEGILAVLYDETQESQLVDFHDLRINSWDALKGILNQE